MSQRRRRNNDDNNVLQRGIMKQNDATKQDDVATKEMVELTQIRSLDTVDHHHVR